MAKRSVKDVTYHELEKVSEAPKIKCVPEKLFEQISSHLRNDLLLKNMITLYPIVKYCMYEYDGILGLVITIEHFSITVDGRLIKQKVFSLSEPDAIKSAINYINNNICTRGKL